MWRRCLIRRSRCSSSSFSELVNADKYFRRLQQRITRQVIPIRIACTSKLKDWDGAMGDLQRVHRKRALKMPPTYSDRDILKGRTTLNSHVNEMLASGPSIRVLFLAWDVTIGADTGDAIHVRRLVKLLADEHPCSVSVIAGGRESDSYLIRPADLMSINFHSKNLPLSVVTGCLALAKSVVMSKRKEYNLIYERGGPLSIGILVSWIRRLPLLLESNGFGFVNFESSSAPDAMKRVLIPIFRTMEAYNYRRADAVVAVSDSIREVLVNELGVSPNKIVLVPNGADPVGDSVFRHPASIDQRGEKARTELCFVGQLTGWYPLDIVVEAFRISGFLRGTARVTVVGDGELKSRLLKSIAETNLQDCFNFVGSVPHADVSRYLSESDACIAPLVGNRPGPSMKILEYMAAGKPIIASKVRGHEIVEEEELGLLYSPEDPQDLARCMEYLVTHRSEFAQKGERGRELVRERYSWTKTADMVYSVIRRFCGQEDERKKPSKAPGGE
jgi:glycosyltransferase involved in cell wall biosynthesis